MKGQYKISIENRKVKYELSIERSVTVIKGNSGTGKTTLVRMVQGYEAQGNKSGIKCRCIPEVELHVLLPGMNWERELEEHRGHILFIDESVDYLYSEAFQVAFASSDAYLVVISRSGRFSQLPYSIESIYELRTERNQDVSLTRMYRLYSYQRDNQEPLTTITEDSNSGMDMMKQIFSGNVISARGNANVSKVIRERFSDDGLVFAIVDGAAYGGYIDRTMNIASLRGNTVIFAPESFEWLLLQLDAYRRHLSDELEKTYDYCDSRDFLTWERYFISLLDKISFDYYGFHYSKKKLDKSLLNQNVIEQVKARLYQNAVSIAKSMLL